MDPKDFSPEYLEKLSKPELIHLILSATYEITERKRAEKELSAANRSLEVALKEKDEFISVVSHEIRTPLNAIVGITDLLHKDFSAAENQENISTLKNSSLSLLRLINDILDFSKIRSGKLKLEQVDFNVPSILNQTRQLFQNQAQEKNILLEASIAEDVPYFVKGDPIRLSQILNNLVSNAVKFTKQGKVTVAVKANTGGNFRSGNARKDKAVDVALIFEVSDTGIGIPADKLDEIFQPFSQAHEAINREYGGTGLGLSIVKNLVEMQGGTIEVKSTENEGTTFSVYLTYERGIEINIHKSVETSPSLSSFRVLYVEDVIANQLLMQRLCANWKVDVEIASDGYEGLQKVKNQCYDLVLMDLRLPRMNGYETAEKMRALQGSYFHQLPIVAVTASDLEENRDKLRQSGIVDIVGKPIDQDKLYSIFLKYAKAAKSSSGMIKPAREHEATDKKIFDQLDIIFQKDYQGYKRTLLAINKEFTNYKEVIMAAMLERDEKKVSDIRHKIAGTSFILEHKTFYTLLKSLNNLQSLSDDKLKALIQQVEDGFDNLINEFGKKIQRLDVETH